MRFFRFLPLALLLLPVTAVAVLAGGAYCALESMLASGKEPDPDRIASLRLRGQEAIDDLFAMRARYGKSPDELTPAESRLLDQLCGTRDCAASRLFWYTDLDRALEVAQREDKPVLSLRLLGRLDEEMSCANSRYFRTALYPDRAIGRLLREKFVLHWRSVRPAPRVTIDFGDGRTIETPVTGNSIHYVLDPRGRLVEAIPGLYAPRVFRQLLTDSMAAVREAAALDEEAFERWARARSREVVSGLQAQYAADTLRLTELRESRRARLADSSNDPRAVLRTVPAVLLDRVNAGGNTMAKVSFESTLTGAFAPRSAAQGPWQELMEVYLEAARLDKASRRLALEKQGVTDPARADALIAAFEADIARDTVLNQYRFRHTLHRWLAADPPLAEVETFNERVYAELFDAPVSDPWMGFVREEAYAGLDGGGRSVGSGG